MIRSRIGATLGLACTLMLTACGGQRPQDRLFQTTPIIATSPAQVSQPSGAYPAPEGTTTTITSTNQPVNAYPAPGATVGPTITPGPSNPADQGRNQSALESYKVALATAKQEFGDVQLYAILPSHIMLRNFGNPPVDLGWFFKFRVANDPNDHFVQVANGRVNGSRSLIPLGDPEIQQPIDLASVKLDSDAVFAKFRERAPALGISVSDRIDYDLELVYLAGSPAPIWSVVTPEGDKWLYSLNATTGEETKNPRG